MIAIPVLQSRSAGRARRSLKRVRKQYAAAVKARSMRTVRTGVVTIILALMVAGRVTPAEPLAAYNLARDPDLLNAVLDANGLSGF